MTTANIQQVKQRFGIIGNAAQLNRAIEVALQVAPTDLSVLVTGESGVGKESFPQIIHHFSHRKHGTYIAVNCGSIPEGTIDSELFGHEKGSFTGATNDRKGYFEEANGGTLFLDEVGELPLSTQARLLRVLESGEFIRVGSSKVQKTDVRVVAATNLNMGEATRGGQFREDLFYRLNTVPISIPPLRKRKEDIALLFRKFASDAAEKYNMPPISLTDDGRKALEDYHWPGNIRQLKNITEQISIIEQNREISAENLKLYLPVNEMRLMPIGEKETDRKTFSNEREILYQVLFDMKKDMNDLKKIVHDIVTGSVQSNDIPSSIIEHSSEQPLTSILVGDIPASLPYSENSRMKKKIDSVDIVDAPEFVEEQEDEVLSLQEMERRMIIQALKRHDGKRKDAAQDLEISERTLYRKIKEYQLEEL